MRNLSVVRERMLDRLIDKTADMVFSTINDPQGRLAYCTVGDDGYSNLERVEMSPLPDDQLFALGMRLATSGDPLTVKESLTLHFRSAPSPLLQEAQRRAVLQHQPETTAELGEQLSQIESDLSSPDWADGEEKALGLQNYANLLSDLWCDPRIYAPVLTRAKMRVLASACEKRSRQIR